jgi:tRNA1(Val) A37 N6-methylase TrmN6
LKLNYFENHHDFYSGLKKLFNELNVPVNYIAEEPAKAQDILVNTYKENNPTFTLINDVYVLGMVDDAAFKGTESIGVKQIEQDYDGILIFGVTLNKREKNLLPTRSQLAEITRAFNREFHYTPVVVVFRYDKCIALANTERHKYKQEWREGEKAGKVSLLRDVNVVDTHTGHLKILQELAITRTGNNAVNSFDDLYKYWQSVFNVSVLNKLFYKDLSNWYFWALKNVYFPGASVESDQTSLFQKEEKVKEHNAKNLIRLLTRILFVWFIKEKKLIPDELFDAKYVKEKLLKKFEPQKKKSLDTKTRGSAYYRAILQNLFFATLNQTMGNREFRKTNGQHMNVTNLMRYEAYFKDSERIIQLVEEVVPFMNGGLFECLDKPDPERKGKQGGDVIIYQDGFSDRDDNMLMVPDYIFFGIEEQVDLCEEYGSNSNNYKNIQVKGLINILKSYKFTITENTPIEEDIALDPELLGKVFENLLASYNPETKTTARKQTGSFYTPREIVNYMVDESLIAYLKNKLSENFINEEELEVKLHQLLSYDNTQPIDDDLIKDKIISALDNCKILDPACGSGAFPMGILQKMVHVLNKLDPNNEKWKERQIEKAELIDDAEIREKFVNDIEEAFNNNELDYGRKLYLIENCIYGVDIQSIAIQISKLRFFISLIVDQKVDKRKVNFGIRPLPNLETKFVAANTLIGIEKSEEQKSIFDNKEVIALEKQLKKIRNRLFNAKTPKTKRKLREEDEVIREKMRDILIDSGWDNYTARQLSSWDPYDQNASSAFFDPEWMFDVSTGFNIVIGNPPYVSANNMKSKDRVELVSSNRYKSLNGKWDLYIAFTEKGLNFLSDEKGIFTFIIPYGFLNQPFAEELRKFILNEFTIKEIVDLHNNKIFENATIPSCIPFIQKDKKKHYYVRISEFNNERFYKKYDTDINRFYESNQHMFRTEDLNRISKLLKKIKSCGKHLSDNFYVSTGAEIHGKESRSNDGENISGRSKFDVLHSNYINGLKPYIEGSAIKKSQEGRYSTPIIDTWLDYSEPEKMRSPKFRELFENEKIIIRGSSGLMGILAIYDVSKVYTSHKCTLIIPKSYLPTNNPQYKPQINIELKYLLAILNSKLMNFYYKSVFGGFIDVYPNNLKELPIVECSRKDCVKILAIVDSIIVKKKIGCDVAELERIIDKMVYMLYRLTEEEIKIIEEG